MTMRVGWGFACVFAVAVAVRLPGQTPPSQPQAPSFRTGIDIVSLTITLTDSGGRYVTGLTREDFTVFEDGAQQEIRFFTRTPLPIALALLLDTSASMEEKLSTAQQAAIGFAQRLRPQDMAEVIAFSSRVDIRQPFTSDIPVLESAIRSTSASGSTSLHNAIYISLKELKKVQARSADDVRRQAIVVLSDGEDTSSLVTFEEVLDLAKRSETAIYAIGLRRQESTHNRGFQEADFVLRQLTQETGGRAFFPNEVRELGGIYDRISEELASQYTIGYASRNPRRDGQWRRLVVRVNRPNVTARTKQGYYAPTGP